MRNYLPGSVLALIITALLLTALSMMSVPTEGSSSIQEVGPLQPVGGEAENQVVARRMQDPTPRRPVSTPRPLVIREPTDDREQGPDLTGLVSPTSARCRFRIGGCTLEMDFQNRTNGFVSNVDVSYKVTRSGRVVRKGYVFGKSELLAPQAIQTAVDHIDDVGLGSLEVDYCIEIFDWYSSERESSAQTTRNGECKKQIVQIEN